MNLLPVGTAISQLLAYVRPHHKKKTCFAACGLPFQPATGLSKFSGGNPVYI